MKWYYSGLTRKYPNASGLFAAIPRRAKPYIALAMRGFALIVLRQKSSLSFGYFLVKPLYNLQVIKMKPLKTKVGITLDSDLVEKLKEFAEKDDRSFSQYINLVLKAHIAKQEKC